MKAMMIALIIGILISSPMCAAAGPDQGRNGSPVATLREMSQSGSGPLDEAQLKVFGVALSALEDASDRDACDETTGMVASLAARAGKDEEVQENALRYLRGRLSTDAGLRAFAALTDQVRVQHGQPQEYGTIFRIDRGDVVPHTAKEAMRFNEARDAIGLVPVEVEARVVSDLARIDPELLQRFERIGIYDCRLRLPSNTVRSELKARSYASDKARADWYEDNSELNTKFDRKVQEEDAKSTKWARDSIDRHLLFSGSGVDRQDIFDTALLIQHSADLPLMKDALPIFSSLVIDSRFSRAFYALMVDRTLMLEKKPQIYGSQGFISNGKAVPENMMDAGGANARRALMNMTDIDDYYKSLNE